MESSALIVQAGERRSSRLESVRAVAALAVLASHTFAYAHRWEPGIFAGYPHRAVMAGGFGVQLFFALSGYLLYRAFVRRDFAGGEVDLRRYVLNRALRILPLYYAVVVVLLVFTGHGAPPDRWWRFLLFWEEFSVRTAQTLDPPIWSLVVEVMFYAALPLIAWGLARLSRGRAARAGAVLVVAATALTVSVHLAGPRPAVIWSFSLPETFWGFVPGMVLALTESSWAGRLPVRLPAWAARSDLWVGASVAIWLVVPLDYSLVYLTAPADFLLLGACVLPLEGPRLVRLLDWRPLAALGVVSYSLYLWHVPVITEVYRHMPPGWGWLVLGAGPLCVVVAATSYAVIERPALLFRSRWATGAAGLPGPAPGPVNPAAPAVAAGGRPLPGGRPRPGGGPCRRTLVAGGALAAVALGVRLAAIAVSTPLRLGSDPTDYDRIGRLLATGRGYGPALLAAAGGPTAFRAPLYPVFLGGVYRLTSGSVLSARVVEAVLGVVTVGLIGLTGQLLWGRRTAWTAALIAAVFPPLVVWSTSLLSESLFLPLELAAVVAALQAARRPDHRLQWAAAAGLAGGLGALARPNGAAMILGLAAVVAAAAPAVATGARRWWRLRQRLLAALAVVVVPAVVAAPWVLRDYADFHRWVPVTTIDGFNLAGEYNSQAASSPYPETYQWRPPTAVPDLAGYFADRRYDEVGLDGRLRAAALAYIARHPAAPVKALFWNTYRMAQLGGSAEATADMREAGFGPVAATAGMVGFFAVVLLATVGVLTGRRRKGGPRAGSLIWLCPLLLWAVSAPLLGSSRIRAPIDPFLVLAAAAGVSALPARRRPGPAVALAPPRRLTG